MIVAILIVAIRLVAIIIIEVVLFLILLIIGRLVGCVDAKFTSVLAPKRRVRVGFAPEMDAMRRRRMRCGRKTDLASAPPKAGVNATVQ